MNPLTYLIIGGVLYIAFLVGAIVWLMGLHNDDNLR